MLVSSKQNIKIQKLWDLFNPWEIFLLKTVSPLTYYLKLNSYWMFQKRINHFLISNKFLNSCMNREHGILVPLLFELM